MKCSDISVGEYVRTYNNGIKRIDTIWENKTVNKYGYEVGSEWDGKLYSIIKTTDIVKHSKDIIDLLEDDDFIIIEKNGYPLQIRTIWETGGELNIRLSNEMIFEDIKNDKEFDIKSILTKEQFEANVYKLEE